MMTKHIAATFACSLTCLATIAPAQEEVAAEKTSVSDISAPPRGASAPQLVREGNELLLDDKAELALQKYYQAKTLAPGAREIAFAEGLSHFQLGDYDLAREQFSQVAGSAGDALADDALYSRGTCDHAQALASSQEPQQAMAKLESAMRTYRDVLARDPSHEAARDANFKAASMWRQIKQQMQQQKQQQQGDNDDENEDQEKQDQQSDQQQQQDQEQDSKDQQSDEQQSSDSQQDEKEQEKQDQSKSDEQKESQQQQAQQSKEEQVSKEQAERKLREMLQELADRQKARQKPVKRLPPPRGGKDW